MLVNDGRKILATSLERPLSYLSLSESISIPKIGSEMNDFDTTLELFYFFTKKAINNSFL